MKQDTLYSKHHRPYGPLLTVLLLAPLCVLFGLAWVRGAVKNIADEKAGVTDHGSLVGGVYVVVNTLLIIAGFALVLYGARLVLRGIRTLVTEKSAKSGTAVEDMATEELMGAFKSLNPSGRGLVISELRRRRDTRTGEFLVAALKDNFSTVRATAAAALGELRDPSAIEPLIDALADKSDLVRRRATRALGHVTNRRFLAARHGPNQKAWASWWEKNKESFLRER